MSRSLRKTPIFGNTTAESEGPDKRIANRRWRSAVRRSLAKGDEEMPHRHQLSDPWSMAKDGKRWMGDLAKQNPEMRRK